MDPGSITSSCSSTYPSSPPTVCNQLSLHEDKQPSNFTVAYNTSTHWCSADKNIGVVIQNILPITATIPAHKIIGMG
jgi:hypothetical protein